jgi:hypothetical protein
MLPAVIFIADDLALDIDTHSDVSSAQCSWGAEWLATRWWNLS